MHATWKQVLLWLELGLDYPGSDGITRLLGDFKLDWQETAALDNARKQ